MVDLWRLRQIFAEFLSTFYTWLYQQTMTTENNKLINTVLGHEITLEYAPAAMGISIEPYLEDKSHYRGPESFPAIVDFGTLFEELGFRDFTVSPEKRWSAVNPPPSGIRILEFENPDVAHIVRQIADIADNDFYADSEACYQYYLYTAQVLEAIASAGINRSNTAFLGLIRAGVAAGEMLGFDASSQTLIQTKRLGNNGRIAIGIDITDNVGLDKPNWLIADPAGATYGSVIANIIYLMQEGYRPERVQIWNTVASHKGSEFALFALRSLGLDVEITAGGYSPGMNSSYYLLTENGSPSVRDAGDALNNFLPSHLRIG
jgi:uracil phosphoribosyltransferase